MLSRRELIPDEVLSSKAAISCSEVGTIPNVEYADKLTVFKVYYGRKQKLKSQRLME